MTPEWQVWSRDTQHIIVSYGSTCVTAYSRPYTVEDAEAFVQINTKLWKDFPLVSSLVVVDTSSWGMDELRLLKDEPTRGKLAVLREQLPDSGSMAIVLKGSGLAAAFTKSLAYGFNFISRSRRAAMVTEIPAGLAWLDEHAQGQVAYKGADRLRGMMRDLDHGTLHI